MQVFMDSLTTGKYNYTYTDLSYSLKYTSTNTQKLLMKSNTQVLAYLALSSLVCSIWRGKRIVYVDLVNEPLIFFLFKKEKSFDCFNILNKTLYG